MSARAKTFQCGHKGFGRFCHRCAQIKQQQQKRQDWTTSFERDAIDLRRLPRPVVVATRHIIRAVCDEGVDYREYRGKQLKYPAGVVSIPVTYRYRLLVSRTTSGRFEPIRCLSHEDYNQVVS
jgi:hypothetical protein